MYSTAFIVGGFLIISLLIIRFWLNKLEEKTKLSEDLVAWLKTSTSDIDQRLSQSMNMFNTRLDQVQKYIGEFSEIGRSMKELEEFLHSPKLRGNIGEEVLKELLQQYFPKQSYQLQYTFKSGDRVDAVIKTSQGIIPIDSKFPMESFRKYHKEINEQNKERAKKDFISDVKKHIQTIAKKYILVEEKTVDYALMYIPSEAVYYEIINNNELFDFCGKNRVLVVSPMSFYAYMKAIIMSFEGQRIQNKAKEILIILQAIKKDYEKTDEAFSILTKHITNAFNQLALVSKNFLSLGQKLDSTHLLSSEDEKEKLLK
jgi:DNA recombination protein RmuC